LENEFKLNLARLPRRRVHDPSQAKRARARCVDVDIRRRHPFDRSRARSIARASECRPDCFDLSVLFRASVFFQATVFGELDGTRFVYPSYILHTYTDDDDDDDEIINAVVVSDFVVENGASRALHETAHVE
jgi:hypothetical protein